MRLNLDPKQFGAARSGQVRLADGRSLAFAEWGDPGGAPVIHFHGVPGSRLELHAPAEVYTQLGIRLITVDRPGCGSSSRQPGRALLDWPEDVAALADDLGLGRFGICALSGGGPFALACAYRLADRLTGVAIAGCMGELRTPGALAGIKRLNRLGLWLARHADWMLDATYEVLRVLLDRAPDLFLSLMTRGKPESDLRLLRVPSVHRQVEAMLAQAVRGGVLGAVQEARLLALPWGFPVEKIRVPVHLWHGDRDDTAPLAHARALAAVIPNAELTVCPGEGHMVMWTHVADMMAVAAGQTHAQTRAS